MSDPHLSSVRQWPYRPDFNQFKRQAKELLKAYRARDANAVAEVQRHEQAPNPTAFALHDAQRVRARQLFAEKPHLAKANIYIAAAVGDVAAVADFLAKKVDVHAKAGPF